MPKVTYKCVDCGKERTTFPSNFSKNVREGGVYRCLECALKLLPNPNPNVGKNSKVSYKCIDCEKESSLRYPSSFGKGITRENYRCKKCALVFLSKDPKWLRNVTDAAQKRVLKTEWKEHNKIMISHRSENPIWVEKCRNTLKRISKDPVISKKRLDAMSEMYDDPIWVENHLIGTTGEGMWYGNKHLIKVNNGGYRKYYCALWNPNLWNRIDAAYDYKSIISGKTRFNNYKQEHLSRHHLYWQEKACCEWDEDAQGYYAWINNGSKRNPEWIKYYIKGDPNKFVLLTRSEHGIIKGNKKFGTDKIYWIKYLEDLIEQREKEGKKCYLSPEEYEVYKIEHAGIIEKYKK
ncbi:MAG: hypothetical protein WCX79_00945 [Candidatus Paceibacterota bacterium]|jgi:DNA-directed RNA polymerase subunit RPC12/RpoP